MSVKIKILFLLPILFFLTGTKVYASDTTNLPDIDYTDIQSVVDDVTTSSNKLNFQGYVTDLLTSKKSFSITSVLNEVKNGLINEVKGNLGTFKGLLSILIIAALFTNVSNAFQNSQVSETGFYLTYLLLFSMIIISFVSVSSLVTNTFSNLLSFMKVLTPSYFLSVAFCSSASASLVFYQGTMLLIMFLDWIVLRIIIPMINIFLVVALINDITHDSVLSKATELLSRGISIALRILMAIVIGFNTLNGLIAPVAGKIKKTAVIKAFNIIPGVGTAISNLASSVLQVGSLLKNAIGVAGIVVILIICGIPLIKLGVTSFIFHLTSAVGQPISDGRLINCLSSTARAVDLLLRTLIVGAFLFTISIIIVAISTS